MKKIILAIFLLLSIRESNAQAFYDAIKLKTFIAAEGGISLDNDSAVAILKKYFKADMLKCDDIKTNKFLGSYCLGSAAANPLAQPKANSFSLLPCNNLLAFRVEFLANRT